MGKVNLVLERHDAQAERWPSSGEHVLAQWDAESIVVYQAYQPSTGRFAASHGYFGGKDFSFNRMSWVKPNFLWMMYRSGWGTKPGQEVTLAIRLRRSFFDRILAGAVASSYTASSHQSEDEWHEALAASQVRLQWDPDHGPHGEPLARRALQLGLRGTMLRALGEGSAAILAIEDISALVTAQRAVLETNPEELMTPLETAYQAAG